LALPKSAENRKSKSEIWLSKIFDSVKFQLSIFKKYSFYI
jgi:hypothetical protein